MKKTPYEIWGGIVLWVIFVLVFVGLCFYFPLYYNVGYNKFQVGKCYELITDNPFQEPIKIKVIQKKGKYIQYVFVFKDTTSGIPWSNSASFLSDYKECDCE